MRENVKQVDNAYEITINTGSLYDENKIANTAGEHIAVLDARWIKYQPDTVSAKELGDKKNKNFKNQVLNEVKNFNQMLTRLIDPRHTAVPLVGI